MAFVKVINPQLFYIVCSSANSCEIFETFDSILNPDLSMYHRLDLFGGEGSLPALLKRF